MTAAPATDRPAAAWHARAEELARWAMLRFVNRTDRCGGCYVDKEDKLVKRMTKPKDGPQPGYVTHQLLRRHFRATKAEDVVGFHPLGPDGFGKWGAGDIDAHPGTTADPVANERFALDIYAELVTLKFRPLLYESDGKGGFHIVPLFDGPVPNAALYRFGAWLVRGHARYGFEKPPETFPKQPELTPKKQYGNWLRLIGRHPKREFWPRVWNGSIWLEGSAAVDHVLGLTGESIDLIPAEARVYDPDPQPDPPAQKPHRQRTGTPGVSIFEQFNREQTLQSVAELLAPHAWEVVGKSTDVWTMRRTGSENDQNGDIKLFGQIPLFYSFTPNTRVPADRGLNPSQLRALLQFGGTGTQHMNALALALEAEGYVGLPPIPRSQSAATRITSGPGANGHLGDGSHLTNGQHPSPADVSVKVEPEQAGYPPPLRGESWNDPHRAARLYLDRHHKTEAGQRTLIGWRGEFHRWDGAAYHPIPDGDLDGDLARHTRDMFEADYPARYQAWHGYIATKKKDEKSPPPPTIFAVTSAMKASIRLNLLGIVNHPDNGVDAPFWLPGATGMPPATEVIAALNGLFTLDDIAAGRGPFSPPTTQLFTPNGLPFVVRADAPPPATWLRCLDQWFDGDEASIKGLQEWCGYALTADTSAQKALMMVGPRRSGKGSILRVLTALVGAVNVASTTFSALAQNFGLEGLIGKRLAIIPDARLSGRTDTAPVIERILAITGEDAQDIDRKNRPRITATLRTRFVLATNELPRMPDPSGAFASRFHLLRLRNSWLGKEDHGLKDRLDADLPGILSWAARGWVRLRANGMRFTANQAAEQDRREFEDLSSPIRGFIRERCVVEPMGEVEITILFRNWEEWNLAKRRQPGTQQLFGRDLHAVLPRLESMRTNKAGETRKRVYRGIRLKTAQEMEGEE